MTLLAARSIAGYRPQGAFYLMLDVGCESSQFARDLLEDRNVAVAPGAAFGDAARRHVRIALCVEQDDLALGISAVLDRL